MNYSTSSTSPLCLNTTSKTNESEDKPTIQSQPLDSVRDRQNQIESKHWEEWTKYSGISPEITALNIESLEGSEVLEKLFISDNLPRTNSGAISSTLRKRYSSLEEGGWFCQGANIFDPTIKDDWGQFKADHPRPKFQKVGNGYQVSGFVKYDAPPSCPTSIYALDVPVQTWQGIAEKYSLDIPKNPEIGDNQRAVGFWNWVKANKNVPIIITEGSKKAAKLLTHSHVSIGLPGIYNGCRKKTIEEDSFTSEYELIPQLMELGVKDREFIFCFDRDTKKETITNIKIAVTRNGKLLEADGAKVSFVSWELPYKGIDDLIVAKGQDFLDNLIESRIPLNKIDVNSFEDILKLKPIKVEQRFLDDKLVIPETAKVIGLKSPKGTGKTEYLSKIVQDAIYEGQRAIVITHREQLSKALALRFGIDYRTELKDSSTRGALGYALCIDSLHPKAHPKFDPEEWHDAIVIIDEVEQVIWHALEGHTCIKNRVKIIESLTRLLRVVTSSNGKVYLADADLSAISFDYILGLIKEPVEHCLIQNLWKPEEGKRKLIEYTGHDPRYLIEELTKQVSEGKKVLVHTTGQKERSKYGTYNLESYLKEYLLQEKILRIDRPSVSDPKHPAYGCMNNLNQIVQDYDVVLCSPVVETGVSIDIKGHFDSVFVIAYGIQTVDAVCQSLERLRDDCDRHIWAKKTAKDSRIGNGSYYLKGLLASQHKMTDQNILLLQQANMFDPDGELETNQSPESLIAWGKKACVINESKINYRESILNKLIEEGYQHSKFDEQMSDCASRINDELRDTRDENYKEYCEKVTLVESPSSTELESLKEKRSLTEEEQLKKRKGQIEKNYGIEVTPELVAKDDNGWYAKLTLHYYLTVGRKYLAVSDSAALSALKKNGDGKVFKPDVNKLQNITKIRALEVLNINQFLEEGAEFTKDTLKEWFKIVVAVRWQIKEIFGVTIHPENDSAIAVAQRILKKLGLKLDFIRFGGGRKNRTRFYALSKNPLDNREQVFDNWLKRDINTFGEEVHTLF